MPAELARQWFVPGEGIDRSVISASIQRYLGNDATVRPGIGTNEHEGIDGYWIKAYRNLTSAMVEDLRKESTQWRREQRTTSTREPYTHSDTFQMASNSARHPPRTNGDSPIYGGVPPPRDPRAPPIDRMPVDSAGPPPTDMRYGPPIPRNYPSDSRNYHQENQGYGQEIRPYPQDQSMTDAPYGRNPVPPSFGTDQRYAPPYSPNDAPPPGYVRQGNFYVPVSSPHDPSGLVQGRSDSTQYGALPYGGPPQNIPPGRDGWDPKNPRYAQGDYSDGRYPYPSPAPTAASIPSRDSLTSPPQPRFAISRSSPSVDMTDSSSYGPPQGQYSDQYGRPAQPTYGGPPGPDPGYQAPGRDANYGRDRQPPPSSDTRDARRRKMH